MKFWNPKKIQVTLKNKARVASEGVEWLRKGHMGGEYPLMYNWGQQLFRWVQRTDRDCLQHDKAEASKVTDWTDILSKYSARKMYDGLLFFFWLPSSQMFKAESIPFLKGISNPWLLKESFVGPCQWLMFLSIFLTF